MTPDREAVALAVGGGFGESVLAGEASVTPYPVAGLPEERVWRVSSAAASHPLNAYVGVWPDGSVRVLTDNPSAFADLAAAAGVTLTDGDTAVGYVRGYLEVTRGMAVLIREVDDVASLPWRPGSEEAEERKAALLADPPAAGAQVEQEGEGFRVQLVLLVGQRIQRNTFDVSRDGTIQASYEVLAADLPLPIVR